MKASTLFEVNNMYLYIPILPGCTMKKLMILLLIGMFVLPMARADIAIDTTTKVYFEKDGKPYEGPVDFTVRGYGYSWAPGKFVEKEQGSYTPEEVFSFSASVQGYGQEINEGYYMNYRHIDYYDMEGQTSDGTFKIEKYATEFPAKCTEQEGLKRNCELKIDLTGKTKPFAEPKPGFWKSILCFFKKLLGRSC